MRRCYNMNIEYLQPPNLATLHHRRRGGGGQVADIETVWWTPYPVLTPYTKLMVAAGISPYGGGSRIVQGARNAPGVITSGYRDTLVNGNKSSPHLFGFAIDVAIGNDAELVRVAKLAVDFFPRVGIYLGRGFLHFDAAPDNWIIKYAKRRYWIKRERTDTAPPLFVSADDFATILTVAPAA